LKDGGGSGGGGFLKPPPSHWGVGGWLRKDRSQNQLPSSVRNPVSSTRPFPPSLSANPFRELRNLFCRLPLPTFLHNTIGCSPWRPEAVYSTVMESGLELIAFSRTFCSQVFLTERHKALLCRVNKTISRLSDSSLFFTSFKTKR